MSPSREGCGIQKFNKPGSPAQECGHKKSQNECGYLKNHDEECNDGSGGENERCEGRHETARVPPFSTPERERKSGVVDAASDAVVVAVRVVNGV